MEFLIALMAIALIVRLVTWRIQGNRRYLCVSCERLMMGVHPGRPLWPFLLLGPFGFCWPKKTRCRFCKSPELIAAESPKAQRLLRLR